MAEPASKRTAGAVSKADPITPATPDSTPAVLDGPALDASASTDDRVTELEQENGQLRAKLAAAGLSADNPRHPKEPSFGISEGTREELERTGKANSPFTGKPLTKADLQSN